MLFSYLKRAPASTILLNSMQKAYKSINMSLGLIILFLIMLLMNTQTRRTSRFWRFLSFLLSSQQLMQFEIYKVRNSLGSSTALANLLISSREHKESSILTSFSKYLNNRRTEIFRVTGEDLSVYWRRFVGFVRPVHGRSGVRRHSCRPAECPYRRRLGGP